MYSQEPFSRMTLATIEQFASDLVGNWRTFESFAWFDRPDNADEYAIIYTSHRDSGLLDQSNAAAVDKLLRPFIDAEDGSVIEESHNHWLVGHVDGYAVKVYGDDGTPSPAIKVLFDVAQRLASYPVLDEDDWSRRESDATYENVQDALRYYLHKADLNLDVPSLADEVIYWIGNNTNCGLESVDDQGGYPSDEELTTALTALGYLTAAA